MPPNMLHSAYAEKIASGELREDPVQASVVIELDKLAKAIENRKQQGFLDRLLGPKATIHGLYIHGDVGRGKTMLMDMFFDSLGMDAKRRVHFFAFMQDVHQRRRNMKSGDVITTIAKDIGRQARVLCLDEMQVSDIADATIIGRLFEALIANGTIIVTTSNLPPGELYKDGLNRSLFLPAIKLLQTRFKVVSLNGPTDYRLGRIRAGESFISPLGAGADRHVQKIWELLTEMPEGQPCELQVLGRQLRVPQAAHGCARFSFKELCEAPLGPADYLAIAGHFRTLFVERIPELSANQNNAVKRFVNLVDTLYDARLHIVASSAQPPEMIYRQGKYKAEFARTVSRLQEMQSASYWGQKSVET
jgi:cell division protein ZapE